MAAQSLEGLRKLIAADAAAIEKHHAEIAKISKRRDERVVRARALGGKVKDLAADAKVSEGRITQLAPKGAVDMHRPKVKPADAPARRAPLGDDELAAFWQPGVALGITATVSERASVRPTEKKLYREDRATAFLDPDSGRWASPAGRVGVIDMQDGSVRAILAGIPEVVRRIFLVSPRLPGVTEASFQQHGSEAEAVRAWFIAPVPAPWVPVSTFLREVTAPLGKWKRDDHEVEIGRAAPWFGESSYTVDEAAAAWALLSKEVKAKFGGEGRSPRALMSTPGTTGRYLWQTTIPAGSSYPVMSDELRALIQGTSGQGRIEMLLPEKPREVETFTHYDMRTAYAKCTSGMAEGAPTMWTGAAYNSVPDSEKGRLLKGRGRWLIRATVPMDWDHVGLLPAPAKSRTWTYPSEPGLTFTTWASGAELVLAHSRKWHIEIIEGFTWKESHALDTWRRKLLLIDAHARTLNNRVGELVTRAVRNVILYSIGAFAGRDHMVTKSSPVSAGDSVLPRTAQVREVDDMYVWEEPGPVPEWSADLQHPEWSAEIWSRCRARLLDAPTSDKDVRTGALHVPRSAVLAMRTDALYLTIDPEWPDDGAIGTLRLKGKLLGPLMTPTTDSELNRMRDASEAAYATEPANA